MPRRPRRRNMKLEGPPERREDHDDYSPKEYEEDLDSLELDSRCNLDTILAKVGLHSYNIHKGTKLQFSSVKKHDDHADYYITLDALDPINHSLVTLQACVWRAPTNNNQILRLISTTCRIKPQLHGSIDGEEEEEYLLWDTHAVDEFFQGSMPKWIDYDAITRCDNQQFYEVKESELKENKWLYLYAEVALFSKWEFNLVRIIDSIRAYLPFEIKKVVVQTTEGIESNMKLKAINAIYYMSFKASEGPHCRAIVRKTNDGRQGNMCLEFKCWIDR
ncbi:unnamed protein product [Cochlearia groenlandica]